MDTWRGYDVAHLNPGGQEESHVHCCQSFTFDSAAGSNPACVTR